MLRKYHNHTPHTNPRHTEEELQNTDSHSTPGRKLIYSNQLSLIPQQAGCKTRKDTKYCLTEQGPYTKPHKQ